MIGNSRLHWAWFVGEQLCHAWDTQHLPTSAADLPAEILPANAERDGFDKIVCLFTDQFYKPAPTNPGLLSLDSGLPPLYIASVVPSQTELWQAYPDVQIITLDQIPLQGVYPTLGIDRALALWGAGETWGYPILVIDAGTALTFTGADANRSLVGGAILPGLGLQLQSLVQKTANLPQVEQPMSLPPRWALNTPESIQSGVIYTLLAGMLDFIEAWWQQFPQSRVCLTGGDGNLLLGYMRSHSPHIAAKIIFEPHLVFWGMRSFCQNQL